MQPHGGSLRETQGQERLAPTTANGRLEGHGTAGPCATEVQRALNHEGRLRAQSPRSHAAHRPRAVARTRTAHDALGQEDAVREDATGDAELLREQLRAALDANEQLQVELERVAPLHTQYSTSGSFSLRRADYSGPGGREGVHREHDVSERRSLREKMAELRTISARGQRDETIGGREGLPGLGTESVSPRGGAYSGSGRGGTRGLTLGGRGGARGAGWALHDSDTRAIDNFALPPSRMTRSFDIYHGSSGGGEGGVEPYGEPRSRYGTFELKPRKDLTSVESAAHGLDMEPERIAAWWSLFEPAVVAKYPALSRVLQATGRQWEGELKYQPEMQAANSWLATNVFPLINQKTNRGKNFVSNLRKRCPEALGDGRLLIQLILDSQTPEPGLEELSRVEEFRKAKAAAFKAGAAPEATKAAAQRLEDIHLTLPANARARRDDLLLVIIEAMPTSTKALKDKRRALYVELQEAHALGRPAPWTFEQLVSTIAVNIAIGDDPFADVNAVDSEINALSGRRGGEGDRDEVNKLKCLRCGERGHSWRDCARKCKNPECRQLPDCPGVRDARQCVLKIKKGEFPNRVKNAAGNPLPASIHNRMKAAWEAHIGKEASPAEKQSGASDENEVDLAEGASGDELCSEFEPWLSTCRPLSTTCQPPVNHLSS